MHETEAQRFSLSVAAADGFFSVVGEHSFLK